MTPENFAYYLQGFLELTEVPGAAPTLPTATQWALIREALASVFHKVTPAIEAESATASDPDGVPRKAFAEAVQAVQEGAAKRQEELLKELQTTRRIAQQAARDAHGGRRIC